MGLLRPELERRGGARGDWLCHAVFYTTMPMYKPVAPMWAALLPVIAHLYYAKQAGRRRPSKRTGANQQKPLDSNCLTYFATAVLASAALPWLVSAVPFFALGLTVFAPSSWGSSPAARRRVLPSTATLGRKKNPIQQLVDDVKLIPKKFKLMFYKIFFPKKFEEAIDTEEVFEDHEITDRFQSL